MNQHVEINSCVQKLVLLTIEVTPLVMTQTKRCTLKETAVSINFKTETKSKGHKIVIFLGNKLIYRD